METVIINLGRNELLTDENVFSRRTHMKKIISRKRFELTWGQPPVNFTCQLLLQDGNDDQLLIQSVVNIGQLLKRSVLS